MKKLLIAAFACTAAMFIACGDDSSSTSSEVVESSSSVVAESGSSIAIEPGDSIFFHQKGCGLPCISAKDTTTMFWYSYDGPDSALTVTKYEYPTKYKEVVENCEGLFTEMGCDSVITTINPSQNMTYMALISLVEKECKPLF